MSAWAIGQRVRSEAEPALGLGTVEGFPTARSVQVHFPAASVRRTYNPVTAPLRRYELGVGQSARTREGQVFRVERIEARAGVLTYFGSGLVVPESALDDASVSHDPLQRLLAGEFGSHEAFDLREAAWRLRSEGLRRRTRGLTGARVALLPHQLAIAYKISQRAYPRVLLADEVGLGKTIEACLIYAALRAAGRADRVLVLTPPSLVHQWLVELYRRFNEMFRVAHGEPLAGEAAPTDADAAAADQPEADNPFADASRLIAPLDWLLAPGRLAQALEQPWDLVIVDEAHHLAWSREHVSPEYAAVAAIARRSQGLLLLTATPLRQGLETEFGLLHLVDPERFGDFARFASEQAGMREVAELARRLAAGEAVAGALRERFPDAAWEGPPAALLQQLIDRHGTGRVLLRNRRDKLGGFPGRQLQLSVLPLPRSWERATAWPEIVGLQARLGEPSGAGRAPDAKDDPRWAWLLATLRSLEGQKAVVIASSVAAVKQIEVLVRREAGLAPGVFHEGLGLVERDRQAAFFADPEGAQVLIASEIGGEGRNFQFCQHLILFDLPLHPDALEQRIGRLDRIGQTGTIQVHVAVIDRTPGQALFAWHRELAVFDAPLTGGEALFEAQAPALLAMLQAHTPTSAEPGRLEAFLADTRGAMARHRAEVQASVDFLIDLNSFDQPLGESLASEVRAFDTPRLAACASALFEYFGVVEEDLADPLVRRLRPGDLMKVDRFPGLRADGCLATYDRERALAREDLQFLSPDHPIIEGALALLLDQAEGRASLALWPGAPERGMRLEFLFLLAAVGPEPLGLGRFLPPTALRVTLAIDGRECPDERPVGVRLQSLAASLWPRLAGYLQAPLPGLLEAAESLANSRLAARVEAAVAQARDVLGGEQQRLEALHALGNLPAAELESHAATMRETLRCLGDARVGLDAVRVVLLDPGA